MIGGHYCLFKCRFIFCLLFLTGDCDFESRTLNNGMCLWENDNNTDFDWTVRSYRTPTISSGPTVPVVTNCKTLGN